MSDRASVKAMESRESVTLSNNSKSAVEIHYRDGSVVFKPYREIGCYSSNAPISIFSRGSRTILASPIGDSFHLIEGDTLRVILTSERLGEEIIHLVLDDEKVFVATETSMYLLHRGRVRLKVKDEDRDTSLPYSVYGLSVIGDLLISHCSDNKIRFYSKDKLDLIETLNLGSDSYITAILHPSTYLNKLLIARNDGGISLWDIRKKQLVYKLKTFKEHSISVMTQSPALDVIAFGTIQGHILLHNIRTDIRVLSLKQDCKVTCISFRQDCPNIACTASIEGGIWVWDLQNARLLHKIETAHHTEIHTLHFYVNQPILISSASDNSIKQWIFDSPDNNPRILRERLGHLRPPTKIRFYGDDPFSIISVSPDRSVRISSTLKLTRSTELSQGSIERTSTRYKVSAQELKLPPALCLDSSGQKHNNWDDIVTCHSNETCARTWSFENKTLGSKLLPASDKSQVVCVSLSLCGNFAIIGTQKGGIDRYNIQSGAHRAVYREGHSAHTLAITGIASDEVNKTLVSSSLDKKIKFWDFDSGRCIKKIELDHAPLSLIYDRSSNLIAISLSNILINVIDAKSFNIVRIFSGHRSKIMDMCFSADSRFIASCSLDGTIRLWDIATGHNVDILKTSSMPTSIAFSPNGNFLASSHLDSNGIFLWTNTMFYKSLTLSDVNDKHSPETKVALFNRYDDIKELCVRKCDNSKHISLSTNPHSRCNAIINIDIITKRNKPIQPKKKPELPPFFLTLASENTPVKLSEHSTQADNTPIPSKILKFNNVESDLVKKLLLAYSLDNYSTFIDYIESLPVSILASEIQLLGLNINQDVIPAFIIALTKSIYSNKNYNTIQAYLHFFIRQNVESIINHPKSEELLKNLLDVQINSWNRLESLFKYILAITNFLKI